MRSSLVIFLLLVWPVVLFAATIDANSSGNFTDTGTWAGGVVPGSSDDVTTSNSGIDVTVENGDNISILTYTPGSGASPSLTIDAGGTLTLNNLGSDAFIINNGFTLNVDGTLIINGNFVVNNNLVLNITGTMIVNGNMVLNNGPNLEVNTSGTLTVDGDFIGGNNTNIDVDGAIDITGDVSVGNGSTLTGDGNLSAGGDCSDGTSGFCESSTLPIKLLFFKANNFGSQVRLEWATYEQLGFDYFCIERSEDGLAYNCIEEIKGIENSDMIIPYFTTDNAPLPGRSYYRLKAVDLDQTFEYFNIVRVDRQAEESFTLYPNPTDGRFTMRLNFIPGENLKYTVYDLKGMIYETERLVSYQSEFQNTKDLAPGLYLVRLNDESGFTATRKLLVR